MKKLSLRRITAFRKLIWEYYHTHGRDLPWRRTPDPYRILVSEFMLKQTQVERVIPKYRAFLKDFPSFAALDCASLAEVLAAWQGLGYNRRALMLKKLAVRVIRDYKGKLPADPELLDELPGIGRGTAGAIAVFAFQVPMPFIETNIRRVYLHFFFPTQRDVPDVDVLDLIGQTLDAKSPRGWYYALMDYGAMLGRREKANPNRRSKHYAKQSRFEGSDRQLRGSILRIMLGGRGFSPAEVAQKTAQQKARSEKILAGLEHDGFLKSVKGKYRISRP